MTTNNVHVPLQAKLLIGIIVVSVGILFFRFSETKNAAAAFQAALPVMDKASQAERDARSQALSKFAMNGTGGFVRHDRKQLTGWLTVKDGYQQLSDADKSELHLLAYRAAFGLADSVQDFSGVLIVQSVDESEIEQLRLVAGAMQ